jgi:DNA-binding transcriptional regulator YiaG
MGTRHQRRLSDSFGTAFRSVSHSPSVASLRQSLGLTRKMFSRLTGYSERAIAEWESGKEQSDSSRQRLTEIHRLRQALVHVIPAEQVGTWLLAPNDALDGFKPLEIIERGEIDRIWRLLYIPQPIQEK